MANFLYRLRFTISRTFGLLPSAEAYEKKETSLMNDLNRFKSIQSSSLLNRYTELKAFVESPEFKEVKHSLSLLIYKGSPECVAESRLASLRSNSSLKKYFTFKDSAPYLAFLKVEGSKKLNRYEELKESINSPEFVSKKRGYNVKNTKEYQLLTEYKQLCKLPDVKKHLKGKEVDAGNSNVARFIELEKRVNANTFNDFLKNYKWVNTPEHALELEYKQLEHDDEIKNYYKVKSSTLLKNLEQVTSGNMLEELAALEDQCNGEAFKARKQYLLSKNKFEQTEEYKTLQEFQELSKNDDIIFYHKEVKSGRLQKYAKWTLTFEDDFNDKKLDKSRWLTRYFWGEALMQKGYSLSSEKQHLTDGENVVLNNSLLRIETRKETAKGFVWDNKLGFFPKEFSYTSGLISTGQSFRQSYGRFEAKVRVKPQYPVFQAFWMVGDKMLPQITIFKFGAKSGSKFEHGVYLSDSAGRVNKSVGKLGLPTISEKFAVFTLDWTKDELCWRVNGMVIRKEKNTLPDQPMYIAFSSGLCSEIEESKLPVFMEMDWVRVFSFDEKSK